MKKPISLMLFGIGALAPAAALAQEVDAGSQSAAVGMGVIAWLIVGLIAGFLASKMVNHTGEGLVRDILLGVVGAWIGGFIFRALGSNGVTGFNMWSILVAFVGGVIVLVLYHLVTGGTARPRSA